MPRKPSSRPPGGRQDTSFTLRGCRIILVDASIAMLDEHQSALVSPDDNLLTHSGGASQAIWTRAGEAKLKGWIADTKPVLHLGDVLESPAFAARADRLLHAITLDLDTSRSVGPSDLRGLYARILTTAAGLGCTRIALPALAAGTVALSAEGGALAAADALDEHLGLAGTLEKVLFALPTELDTFARVFAARFKTKPPSPTLQDLLARLAAEGRPELWETWQAYAQESGTSAIARLTTLLDHTLRLVQHAADPARGAHMSLWKPGPQSETLREVRNVAETAQRPVPPAVIEKLTRAIHERNRLAHELPLDVLTPELTRTILGGVEAGTRWALHARREGSLAFVEDDARLLARVEAREPECWPALDRPPSSLRPASPVSPASRPRPMRLPSIAERPASSQYQRQSDSSASTHDSPVRTRRPRKSANAASPALVAAPVQQGTAHVRTLQRFLLDRLDREELDDLLTRLRKEGYVGEDELCLLEYCVRDPPLNILTEHFTPAKLRLATAALVGTLPPQASKTEIARLLLRAWGFPRDAAPRGIHQVAAEVQRAMHDARHQTLDELRGAVTRITGQLEYVLNVLVWFLCRAIYSLSPETVLSLDRPLLKSPLGILLDAVDRLAKKLRDEGGGGVAFGLGIDPSVLLEQDTHRITRLRNTFTHLERRLERPVLAALRSDAHHFFSAVAELVEVVGRTDGNLFPQVVRIDEIVIDRWGRRSVHAIDEYGKTERIFTDMPLEAGQIYFMRSRTNPLCIDPILVPAGDLGGGDAR